MPGIRPKPPSQPEVVVAMELGGGVIGLVHPRQGRGAFQALGEHIALFAVSGLGCSDSEAPRGPAPASFSLVFVYQSFNFILS